MTDRPDIPRSPFEDEKGPRLLLNGVWLRPSEIQLDEETDGCGCLLALIVVGALVGLAAIFGSGCAPTYTVVAADREVVPVYQNGTLDDRKTYIEDTDRATGWYVPDATMLELLEAD